MSSTEPVSQRFEALGLPIFLLESLTRRGYDTATPIQAATIPQLLDGQDIVGLAQTGTGKTAAFALPALTRIELAERKPQVLVLCPTRELALQVGDAFRQYGSNMKGLKVAALCGGADMRQQLRALKEGVHIVVAT
ncbi:MAG: DEAD/DEAH box helicase, partial [Halieaceae bacterium]